MKKLFQTSLTIALLAFMSTTVSSQNLINNTVCPMEMGVAWGTSSCVVNGSFSAVVPAFSSVPFPMPAGDIVVAAKGAYVGSSCVFYVGIPCSSYPMGVFVPCPTPCGDYKAHVTGFGLDVEAYQ